MMMNAINYDIKIPLIIQTFHPPPPSENEVDTSFKGTNLQLQESIMKTQICCGSYNIL